ncbi:MAG TPA: ABC transporter ATP-binding protein [Anaerolineae bacterium]
MLHVDSLEVSYGRIKALKGVSLEVCDGEIVALIGSNGAGKTTTLKAISGLLEPRAGSIVFDDEEIDGLAPDRVVQRGISHVPEGRGIFQTMSVLENLELGCYAFPAMPADTKKRNLDRIYGLFPILEKRKTQMAGQLSGGEQQMLAIGRALMGQPRLLLLDEPSLGLAPLLVQMLFNLIGELNRDGQTILLVEQNARMALSIAHRGYVMETGRVVLADTAARLARDEAVNRIYLGS